MFPRFRSLLDIDRRSALHVLGTGAGAGAFAEYARRCNYPLAGFIDDWRGEEFMGLPIISSETYAKRRRSDDLVIVATSSVTPTEHALRKLDGIRALDASDFVSALVHERRRLLALLNEDGDLVMTMTAMGT